MLISEHKEQVAFVSWFRMQHPGVEIFAIPNGGARNKIVACKLKSEGVTPGVPDLFIPEWRIWIEMKRAKGGVLSGAQRRMIEYLGKCGYVCITAHGCDDAIEKLKIFKKNLMKIVDEFN